jgi:hypothetical protein
MKKLFVFLLVLAVAAGGLFAQEAGTWSVGGWARAGFSLDIENEAVSKDRSGVDPSGAEATVTYEKGEWKVAGRASVTTEDFGHRTGGSGDITTTFATGDWTVIGKIAQDYVDPEWKLADQDAKDADPAVILEKHPDSNRQTVFFSVENWKQADNNWGIKGSAKFDLLKNGGFPYLDYTDQIEKQDGSIVRNGDNKAGLFLNFWEKKILVETGFGNYSGAVWTSPGPLEKSYDHVDDRDSLVRVQFKELVPGLNFGFAFLPPIVRSAGSLAGWADPTYTDWEVADAVRATTLGVKFAPSDNPLVLAAGFNLWEDHERAYAGVSYKLMEKQLTLSFDGEGQNLGKFGDDGLVNLGERVVFVDNPDAVRLEAGLKILEVNIIHNEGGKAKEDKSVAFSPYVWYNIIDKVARIRLDVNYTMGLGDNDLTDWSIVPSFGWSLKESPHTDANDIGTGFTVKYYYGNKEENNVSSITNKLYFGFKAAF